MDDQIRLAAFEWLDKQTAIHGDVLPREFTLRGKRLLCLVQRGYGNHE